MAIDERIYFIGKSGRKLYEMVYDISVDSFVARDLSLLAPHLMRPGGVMAGDITDPLDLDPPLAENPSSPSTGESDASHQIANELLGTENINAATSQIYPLSGWIQMAYQQNPHKILWGVRSDGLLVGITLDPGEGIFAFHRHPQPGRAFRSIGVLPDPDTGQDRLWAVVAHQVGETTYQHIEYMTPFIELESGQTQEEYFFADGGLRYDNTPTSTLTLQSAFSHWVGETLAVWADGSPHPDVTVAAGGVITLDAPYSNVVIGRNSAPYIKTLRLDDQGAPGSLAGRRCNAQEVMMRVRNTLCAGAGDDLTRIKRYSERPTSDALESSPSLTTGDVYVTLQSQWSDRVHVYVAAEGLCPLEVQMIRTTIEVGD